MSVRRKPTPSYLLHQQSGRARAVWTDTIGTRHQRLLPGVFDSPESRTAFARLQLELETSPAAVTTGPGSLSVAEVLCAYLEHADGYYRTPDGTPTSEVREIKASIKPVRELYGLSPATDFGPKSLAAVRQHMVKMSWCRSLVNKRIDRVKRAFKWAVAEELVPPNVYEALRTLPGLRRGRSAARERSPVKPVPEAVVTATLPFMPHHVRVMVELMGHTGMRPAEVCGMTLGAIDRSGMTWLYRPRQHKTAHHGKGRVIPLGPNARDVLSAVLAGRVVGSDDPIFSPRAARDARYAQMREKRRSKVTPSQENRCERKPKKSPGTRYSALVIGHAIRVACEKAFPPPPALAKRKGESRKDWWKRLSVQQQAEVKAWRREHHWHPYQIRHAYATVVRKEYGLEAAQVLLGHSRADVTQVYAERNEALAAEVAARIG